MSVGSSLRRLWLNVHLCLGLGLLLPVGLIGLSGSVLVFHDELERALSPARYAVTAGPPAQPSRLVEAARIALGEDFAVASLRYGEHPGEPVVANARARGRAPEGQPAQSRRVYLDASSARVIDIANPRGGFFGVMHQLHGTLLIPEVGRKVVGWMGWSLLISALSGLWLWWPRSGAFLKAWRWRRGPLLSFNLHHLVGFWIAIPLAVLAATGIYISFPQSARSFAQWVTQAENPRDLHDSGPPRGGGQPLAHTHLGIDEVAAIARAAASNADLVQLTLPTRPRGDGVPTWRAELRGEGGEQNLQLTVSDVSGQAKLRASNPTDGLALLMRRIHDGNDQGLWWRVLVAVGGVAPAFLGLTGLLIWLKSEAAKRAAKRAEAGL